MKQTLKIMAISALATAAVIKAVPAACGARPGQNVSIVQTADLDLTRPAAAGARPSAGDRGLRGLRHGSDADLVGQNQARECRSEVLGAARARGEQLAAGGSPIQIAARR